MMISATTTHACVVNVLIKTRRRKVLAIPMKGTAEIPDDLE